MTFKKTVSVLMILTIPLFYIGIRAEKPKEKLSITRFEQNKPFQGRPKPTPTPIPDMATDVNLETRVKIYCFNQTEFTYTTIETEYLCRGYITAYCNCSKCCTYANQATASGVYPHYSDDPEEPTTCAIDPRYFRFGDLFMIDGKIYVAEDTGSAVKGYHWDLYQEDHSSVQSFDSHYADVYRVTIHTHTMKGEDFNEHLNTHLRSRGITYRVSPRYNDRKRLQG